MVQCSILATRTWGGTNPGLVRAPLPLGRACPCLGGVGRESYPGVFDYFSLPLRFYTRVGVWETPKPRQKLGSAVPEKAAAPALPRPTQARAMPRAGGPGGGRGGSLRRSPLLILLLL